MSALRTFFALGCLPLWLCACTNSGGYFQNDGPPSSTWGERDFTHAPNAVPRIETPHKAANRPYTINGTRYTPITGDAPMTQTGIASWYGKQFHGNKTSTGETYDMFAMTAAHTTMELPSYAKVTNLENGKSVIVRVNDRGPFLHNRVIDLSYAAASKLGYVKKGTAKVKIERIRRADIKSGRFVTPGAIQMVESINQENKNNADLIALAAILGETATGPTQQTTTTLEPKESTANISVPATTASGLMITETSVDLSGATNLTEVAKQGEMVSTETGPDIVENEQNSTSKNWSIQAGVFSKKTNAIAKVEKLRDLIKQPIDIIEDNGRYRILIGQFFDKKTASNQAEAIGSILGEKFIAFERK